jgi:hypothetical protein
MDLKFIYLLEWVFVYYHYVRVLKVVLYDLSLVAVLSVLCEAVDQVDHYWISAEGVNFDVQAFNCVVWIKDCNMVLQFSIQIY